MLAGCEWEGDDIAELQGESGEAFTVADKVLPLRVARRLLMRDVPRATQHEVWVFHMSPDDTGASAVWVAQRFVAALFDKATCQ